MTILPPPPPTKYHAFIWTIPPSSLTIMLSYEYLLLVQSPVLFAWDFPVSGEDPVEVDTNTNTDESNTQEKKRKSTQCAHKWKAEGWNWIKAPYQYNITAGLTLHWKTKGWLYLYSEKNETSLDWENGSGMMRESKRGNFHKGVIYTKYAWKTYLPKSSRFLTIYQTKRTNSIFQTKYCEFLGSKNVFCEKSPMKIFEKLAFMFTCKIDIFFSFHLLRNIPTFEKHLFCIHNTYV